MGFCKRKKKGGTKGAIVALSLLCLASCAADPGQSTEESSDSSTSTIDQTTYPAARVNFHFSEFHTLYSPNDMRCAGDAAVYYQVDAIETEASAHKGLFGAAPFEPLSNDGLRTQKPAFIRNISVDLTDANANVTQNQAYSCSYGNGDNVPPTSSCATFDYGAIGGIPTSMGGSFLLLGGISNYNYANTPAYNYRGPAVSCGQVVSSSTVSGSQGINLCESKMYALGIETLPANMATDPPNDLVPGLTEATTSISSWANLSASSTYSGPVGATGAAVAYNPELQRVLLFGGSSPLSAEELSYGVDTSATWSYDLKSQTWNDLSGDPLYDNDIISLPDLYTDTNGSTYAIALLKSVGARALFGYAAMPGVSLTGMSTTGTVSSTRVDATDRVVVIGGLGAAGTLRDTHKFNPTFGPELVDALKQNGTTVATAGALVQWADSHHTQNLSNAYGSNVESDNTTLFEIDNGTTNEPRINFGAVALYDASAKAGIPLGIGGFDPSSTTLSDTTKDGYILYLHRHSAPGTDTSSSTSNFAFVPANTSGVPGYLVDILSNSYLPLDTTGLGSFTFTADATTKSLLTPGFWQTIDDSDGKPIYNYGGVNMHLGFSLGNNDVVYFGGSNCRDYLTDTSASGCTFANPGQYFRFTSTPTTALESLGTNFDNLSSSSTLNLSTNSTTTYPQRAGMASARGEDGSGNVIIVAWGGMSGAGTAAGDNKIYYLYNAGSSSSPTPKWATYEPTGTVPTPAGNAALVYSHVTRKFYLFGGYQTGGVIKTLSDTWELSVSGACSGSGTCAFTWRQLNVSGGLTCYPDCPSARRSHRLVEVNYNNTSPTSEPSCTSKTAPCSFGIFMEGGTPNGIDYYSDRWIFDPTANAGNGHWQNVDGMPPRRLAMMADVNYVVPSQNITAHRAILFGGETGMQGPALSAADPAGSAQYFVAPTLGDTFMFDYSTSSWNRVRLLGFGTKGSYAGSIESESRQAYDATSPSPSTLSELSPPALAGGIMVTRTHPRGSYGQTSPITPLRIPEVFLFGGRLKDSTYMPLNRVYKFCTGSSGEKPAPGGDDTYEDDASCDAYDEEENPDSPYPVKDYVGRWLRKTPPTSTGTTGIDPENVKSYLGAAAYDPTQDKFVLVGGLTSETAVTETTRTALEDVYEYTPPSKQATTATDAEKNGSWSKIPRCTGSGEPSGRYGHVLGYDGLNEQLVMVGGYEADGSPLTQSQTDADGKQYNIPEIWAAKRDFVNTCYTWRQITVFGNSVDIPAQAPPETGIGHAAGIYVPSTGYNTGYYTLLDNACGSAGPIATGDSSTNKLMAGGVYIDLDREKLGANESLLLNLTYMPLGQTSTRPDGQKFESGESAVIKIHLIETGLGEDKLMSEYQPRHMEYASSRMYPRLVQSLSVVSTPGSPFAGQLRQDQVIVPLGVDSKVDRIRIERYSGSAILIDAAVYRMGSR